MPRPKTPTLTEAELRVMKIIWKTGTASVSDVHMAMPSANRLAYNTILTMMRILEHKGYLERHKSGRAHVYQPLVSPGQARRKAVKHLLSSLFDDSPEQLVLAVLQDEPLSPQEIARLKELIDKRG
jgi:predicted transcriptional regulator